MLKTAAWRLAFLLAAASGTRGQTAGEPSKPQANAPVWARIILDEEFSNKGKVWAFEEELYGILKANGRAPGKLDKVFCLGDALRDTGIPIEPFLQKYGPGTPNRELQSGTEHRVYSQIGLGFKPGEDHFTSLCAYELLFDQGFVASARKALAEKPAGGGAKSEAGEKAVVELLALGQKDSYDRLFTPGGEILVAMSNTDATGQSVVTRYYTPGTRELLGFFYAPQNPKIARLTRQQVTARCGAADQATGDQLTYGKVSLSFGKDGRLSKVTIQFKK